MENYLRRRLELGPRYAGVPHRSRQMRNIPAWNCVVARLRAKVEPSPESARARRLRRSSFLKCRSPKEHRRKRKRNALGREELLSVDDDQSEGLRPTNLTGSSKELLCC